MRDRLPRVGEIRDRKGTRLDELGVYVVKDEPDVALEKAVSSKIF